MFLMHTTLSYELSNEYNLMLYEMHRFFTNSIFFQQLCIKELTLKLFNIKGNPKKIILLIINNIVILTFKI